MPIKKSSSIPGAEIGARVPISSIPKVQEMVDLSAEIEAFRAEHVDVFLKYADLVDRYNAAREMAEKEVRKKGVSCGPFVNYSVRVTFNAEKMFEELGEEDFLKNGGSIAQKTVYEVDKDRVNQAIAAKAIPEECIEHFTEISKSYKSPKPMT